MQKRSIYAFTLMSVFVASGMTMSAQSYSREVKLAGVPGLIAHELAPDGFDPAAATAAELDEYGFPPRPDVNDQKRYSIWLQVVHTKRVTGEYVNTGRYHRPAKNLTAVDTDSESGVTKYTSGNWSGFAITNGSPEFVSVEGRWTIPTIASQHESFTGYMSEWVGIDGDGNGDLIQDGIEEDWTGGSPHYNAWIEFIPNPEVAIPLAVTAGDAIYAQTWESEKSGVVYGNYIVSNLNSGQHVSASLKIPAGQHYLGQTAEWIVERTDVNGSFNNPMPDYAFAYMDDAYAVRSNNKQVSVSSANQNIAMAQGSTKLSEVTSLGSDAMLFNWVTYF